MFGPSLALVLVLGLPAPTPTKPDSTVLVEQLGSRKFAESEAAEARLNAMGRLAVPALRVAKNHKDRDVRGRASAILARIEQSLLVQATPVSFDFNDVPIGQAVQAINRQAELHLTLDGEEDPFWATRRLTLRSADPLPFWKGMDALCQAGGLHHVLGAQELSGEADASFLLHDGFLGSSAPVSDSGPFRVQLSSVHYVSEVLLSQPRPGTDSQKSSTSMASKQFFLQLLVAAEPGLSVTQDGPVRLSQATDDRGRSLLIPDGRTTLQRSSGYFGVNPSPMVRLRVDLIHPDDPGRQIKKLKGKIPVVVAARRSNPLEISLQDSDGKSFENDEIALTVRSARPAQGGQPSTIELTWRVLEASATMTVADGDLVTFRPEASQQQWEVLDAQGKTLPWFPTRLNDSGNETTMTLTIPSRGNANPPALLRYHGTVRTRAEVPFEFFDVPMP